MLRTWNSSFSKIVPLASQLVFDKFQFSTKDTMRLSKSEGRFFPKMADSFSLTIYDPLEHFAHFLRDSILIPKLPNLISSF